MSWTSEHEPSPPRPIIETDDPADLGFEVVEDPDGGDAADSFDLLDEGPLDPSVFDGLFADLAEPAPPSPVVGPAPDEPAGPIGIVAVDLVTEPSDVDQAQNGDDPFADLFDDVTVLDIEAEPPARDEPTIDDVFDANGNQDHIVDHDVEGDQDLDDGEDLAEPGVTAVNGSTTMPGIEPDVSTPSGVGGDPMALLDHSSAGRTSDIYDGPEAYHPRPQIDPATPSAPPAIQPDPPPTAVPALRTADQLELEPVLRPSVDRSPRSGSRWRSFGVATTVGALLGIGGAFVLTQILNRDSPSIDTAVLGDQVDAAGGAIDDTDPAGPILATSGPVELEPVDRFELNSLRFEPGTDRLAEGSDETLDLLTQAIAQRGDAPIAATVRTYTETSTADDLALSIAQADALAQQLVERGADPDLLVVTGLGRSLLTVAQPVPNFVVASAGLEMSPLRSTLNDIDPFAIGLDSIGSELRPESRLPLARIGEAMRADSDGRSITLSSYSFAEADAASNRSKAAAAAEAAAAYIGTNYGIDRSRIDILVLGEAPYGVTSEVGNHVGLRWGDLAVGSVALADVSVDEIDFAPDSTTLSRSATGILDQLLEAMVGNELAVVVDVHSFDGPNDEANHQLSRARAAAISEYLTGAGLPPNRLRVYGRGDRPQFRSEESVARVVVSLVPSSG